MSPPLGSHSVVGRDVDGVGGGVVFDSQTQICDGRRAVLLHQDVFGLEVSVSNGGFSWTERGARRDSLHQHAMCSEETEES